MGVLDYLGWAAVPVYLASLGMIALAVGLYSANPRAPPNRAFTVYLVLWAVSLSTQQAASYAGSEPVAHAFWAVQTSALLLAWVPLVLLASTYPRRRGPLARHRWVLPVLWVVAGLAVVARAVDPGLGSTIDVEVGGGLNDISVTGFGPLMLMLLFAVALPSLLALRFAIDARRMSPGRSQRSIFLLAVGFTVYAVYRSGRAIASVLPGNQYTTTHGIQGRDLVYFVIGEPVFQSIALIAAVSASVVLFRQACNETVAGRTTKRPIGLLFLVLGSLGLGIWIGTNGASSAAYFFFGFVVFTLPALATYALVRHSLFDIDMKVRWTVNRSTIAAVFVSVFFVASELAKEFFSMEAGPWIGIFAAGLLVFALSPLQRIAQRVADAAVPDARPIGELQSDERAGLYHEMAQAAWADRVLTVKERDVLDVARVRLGLTEAEAAAIERKVREAGAST